MDSESTFSPSDSYFWNCLTLSENCPYFSTSDPMLFYFAIILTCLYAAFIFVVLADIRFYWTLDRFQEKINCHIHCLFKRVKHIQMNQRKLVSTKARTEKQLKRSEESNRVVTVLRGTVSENFDKSNILENIEENDTEEAQNHSWFDDHGIIDLSQ